MPLNKSTTRRLSLLAGASLVATGLTVFAGASLTPTAALAYDECTPANAPTTQTDGVGGASDPGLNGATADSFSCTSATYVNGIAYSSNGNLTVTKTNSGGTTITNNGIDLVGNGADSVTWVSSLGGIVGGAVLGGPGPVGPLLDITTGSGAINITTGVVTANRVGTTYGVRARSGDALASIPGGNITIVSTQGVNNNIDGGITAVETVTNGGAISLSYTGNVQGRQRGVFAQTNGAGSVTMTMGAVSGNATDGIAIDVIAGTGGITLTTNSTVSAGSGLAIRAATTGSAIVTHTNGVLNGALDFSGVAGGVTFNVPQSSGGGQWSATGASIFSAAADTLTLVGGGGNRLADGASIALGAGNDAFNINSGYAAGAGTIDFGTGDDRLALTGFFSALTATATTFNFGTGADTLDLGGTLTSSAATFNFGADADVLSISGTLVAAGTAMDFGTGTDSLSLTSTGRITVSGLTNLTLSNLETFNNAGSIFLGGQGGPSTNSAPGDVFTFSSGTYTGSGDGRIVLDVNFVAGGQTDCSTASVADCAIFTGATTAGTTLLTIKNAGGSTTSGSSSRTVVVIGASEADDFVLDPDSDGYVTTAQGGALRNRLFDFFLLYDDAVQQHLLAAVPHIEAFQVATFAAGAQDIWRSTTGSWFERQADLRATPGGIEPSRGLWAQAGVSAIDRDVEIPLDLLGTAFLNDVSYKQRTSHAVFGADLVGAATQDSSWVIGANAGFVRSDAEYETPSTEVTYAGFTGGLYASWIAGPVFVDAALNANVVDVNTDMPSLGFDSDVKLVQTITSVGGQLQAGWRIAVGEAMFAEPLASVSYVQTELDGIEVPGDAGSIGFEDGATSFRAGAGLRLGADTELMGMPAGFSLTGRYWNEIEGENATILAGNAPTALIDDFSGAFSEVAASLNLYSDDGVVSGFVNLGGKFADDYRSIDGSVGVRVRW